MYRDKQGITHFQDNNTDDTNHTYSVSSLSATPCFVLRPLQRSDSAMLLAGRNSDRVRPFMLTNHIITEHEHRQWMENRLGSQDKPYFVFMHNNKPMGLVGLTHFDKTSMTGEWGFYVWDADAPKGSGTHMLAAFLDEMFLCRALCEIRTQVITSNDKSLHLHRKLGFSQETPTQTSTAENVTLFAISNNDWHSKRMVLMPCLSKVAILSDSQEAPYPLDSDA